MSKVKYVGPSGSGVDIPLPDGRSVSTDENGIAEVPDDVAKSLLEQDAFENVKSERKGDS